MDTQIAQDILVVPDNLTVRDTQAGPDSPAVRDTPVEPDNLVVLMDNLLDMAEQDSRSELDSLVPDNLAAADRVVLDIQAGQDNLVAPDTPAVPDIRAVPDIQAVLDIQAVPDMQDTQELAHSFDCTCRM